MFYLIGHVMWTLSVSYADVWGAVTIVTVRSQVAVITIYSFPLHDLPPLYFCELCSESSLPLDPLLSRSAAI